MKTMMTRRSKTRVLAASDFKDKRVLVVGLARSGVAACKVLRQTGAVVKATDKRVAGDVAALEDLRLAGVVVETGGHSQGFAEDCDLVVVSPGVPPEIDLLVWARGRGKMLLGEVELAWCLSEARFAAVSGTNGKTTTTSLLGAMVSRGNPRVRVGGNIGDPISALAAGLGPDWTAVIEISSFQLDTCISFSPDVSVLLNITPDHLDRYRSYADYFESKKRLFMNQDQDDFAVVNFDDREAMRAAEGARARKLFFSVRQEVPEGAFVRGKSVVVRVGKTERELFATGDLRIRGPHNLANGLASSLAATVLDTGPGLIREAARDFEALEHRFEAVATIGGVEVINDSKATNVDSLWWALETAERPVVLIAGGRDKGGDFEKVRDLVARKVKAVVAIGEARDKLVAVFSGSVRVEIAGDLEAAVRSALGLAAPGDMVLLSPGCASYDMFKDFEHRGRAFKEIAMRIKAERGEG
jgi:UDP-N-acetylmuramoylalanine--D-glutamate ligase